MAKGTKAGDAAKIPSSKFSVRERKNILNQRTDPGAKGKKKKK